MSPICCIVFPHAAAAIIIMSYLAFFNQRKYNYFACKAGNLSLGLCSTPLIVRIYISVALAPPYDYKTGTIYKIT